MINKTLPGDAFDELVRFIKGQTGSIDNVVTRDTLIEDDQGVTGDDASDLIQSFSKKYLVDISEFIFATYFNEEPSVFTSPRMLKPFRVGDLEKQY